MSDQLTPVLGYRRLVSADERTAPSFLLESVEGGASVGRFSILGAQPSVEVVAHERRVTVRDHERGTTEEIERENPLTYVRSLTAGLEAAPVNALGGAPGMQLPAFTGGWVGYAGYDTVRYLEPEKLPFSAAPHDDRGLPDLHFGLYRQVVVFDHVAKVLQAIHFVLMHEGETDPDAAYERGAAELNELTRRLETHSVPLAAGAVDIDTTGRSSAELVGNFDRPAFENAVMRTKEHIAAGDAFQVVISQRFERRTNADPFDIYRALRIVNPSPYMIYLQAEGSILVASSPEILCRVEDGAVTNRPLAGTRKRGRTDAEDLELERDLRSDAKETAEHVMLVDLGRNDLGRVCQLGSISLDSILDVERYSHVMHLSSTVRGQLRSGLDAWDALRHTLPVGTVSGAPKVRAMQIIDDLEPTRRGPYAGGIGYVSLSGQMDMAIALRTMVVPVNPGDAGADGWTVHLQAGAGIVADSVPASEYDETVNKAAGLNRAIDLAEHAFARGEAADGS